MPDTVSVNAGPIETNTSVAVASVEVDNESLRRSLEQPVCQGAFPFLAMTGFCVLLGLAAPIVCFVLMDGPGLLIAGIACCVCGLLFCCWGMHPVLFPKPPTPATSFPLTKSPIFRPPKKVYAIY